MVYSFLKGISEKGNVITWVEFELAAFMYFSHYKTGTSLPSSQKTQQTNKPNLQGWYLTLRWFNVISRTLVGLVIGLCSDEVGVFYNPSRLGCYKCFQVLVGVVIGLCSDEVGVFYNPSRLGCYKCFQVLVITFCKLLWFQDGGGLCNGYRRKKWTQWHEFKSWTRLIAFHIALVPLGKIWIQLFSL